MTAIMINVKERGAVGDGKTPCTDVVQKAIDQCSTQGGGTVVVPAGRYLVGTIQLKDNVDLPIMVRLGARLRTFHKGDASRNVGAIQDVSIKNVQAGNAADLRPASQLLDVTNHTFTKWTVPSGSAP